MRPGTVAMKTGRMLQRSDKIDIMRGSVAANKYVGGLKLRGKNCVLEMVSQSGLPLPYLFLYTLLLLQVTYAALFYYFLIHAIVVALEQLLKVAIME